jgi:hypothetical protein
MSRNGRNRPRPAQVKKALARAQDKERARVAVHIDRLQQLQAGDQNPHIQKIFQQINLLVEGHNSLATACNANWKGFGDSIQHLDARVGAIAQVLDDLVRGGIPNITTLSALESPDGKFDNPMVGGVHWPGYIKMYIDRVTVELAELKARHQAQAEASQAGATEQTEPFDPLITPNQEEAEPEDVVFGGKDEDVEAGTGSATGTEG